MGVQQQGADVTVRLLGPGGEELATADSPTVGWGREELWWVAEAAGSYTLEIRFEETPVWAYRLELQHGTATEQDRRRARAFGLYLEAEAHRRASGPGAAEAAYRRAVQAFAEVGEGLAEGRAWQRLATLADGAERWAEAADLWGRAAAAYGRAGAARDRATALEEQGELQIEQLGQPGPARPLLLEALETWERLEVGSPSHPVELAKRHASSLHLLGLLERAQGRPLAAIERFRAAARLWRESESPKRLSVTLAKLADVYLWLRHLEPAAEALAEAESAARLADDPATLALVLGHRGTLERRQGNLGASERALREALALERAIADPESLGYALNDLAQTRFDLGDGEGARQLVEEGLAGVRPGEGSRLEAYLRMNLGWILERSGQPAAGLPHLERAVALHRALAGSRDLPGALWGLGRSLRKLGRLEEARAAAAEAVELAEATRQGLAAEGARGSFFGDRQRYVELLVEVSMDLERDWPGRGWARRALLAAERGRARLLLDALEAARENELREPVGAGQRAPIEADLERARIELLRLTSRGEGGPAVGELEREITRLSREWDESRARESRRAWLAEPPSLSALAEAQGRLVEGERLLVYALGDERSWLWMLGPGRERSGEMVSVELPPRQEIEPAARALHELLGEGLEAEPEEIEVAAADLARRVLWPAGELGGSRLILVPDGALHYVPFGLLLEGHEVSTTPSLAVWAETLTPAPLPTHPTSTPGRGVQKGVGSPARGEDLGRALLSGFPLSRKAGVGGPEEGGRAGEGPTVAVVANPVYVQDDPRLAAAGRRGLPAWLADASGFSSGWLASLPATGKEAAAILARVPPERRLELTGTEASVENVLSGRLASASIVHFATHGLLDTEHPELSGLALSQYDAEGRPLDGILWAYRLDELVLSAELVVLSACSTALGQELRGEGLLGLTQGFLAAGARQVLVTLWDVEEEATAQLMDRFYEQLLEGRRPPAEALAAAQRALAADPRWSHPYHWAGFVLVERDR